MHRCVRVNDSSLYLDLQSGLRTIPTHPYTYQPHFSFLRFSPLLPLTGSTTADDGRPCVPGGLSDLPGLLGERGLARPMDSYSICPVRGAEGYWPVANPREQQHNMHWNGRPGGWPGDQWATGRNGSARRPPGSATIQGHLLTALAQGITLRAAGDCE